MHRFLASLAMAGALGASACGEAPAPPPKIAAAAAPPTTASPSPSATAVVEPPERAWSKVLIDPVDVTFPSGPNTLRGIYVKPAGDGPFPALLWNHGSEQNPAFPRRIAKFWVAQNFAFFAAMRRGHAGSGGEYWKVPRAQVASSDRAAYDVGELERQADDVSAAATWLRAQPFIDPQRIVVAGCSFGGIETVFAAERDGGLRGALDFAGAAMSWEGNPLLRDRLRLAVRRAKVPLFFIQAENDYNLEPTHVFAAEAQQSGRPFKAKIYPPNGDDHQAGHLLCVLRPDVWGADVLAFLKPLLR